MTFNMPKVNRQHREERRHPSQLKAEDAPLKEATQDLDGSDGVDKPNVPWAHPA